MNGLTKRITNAFTLTKKTSVVDPAHVARLAAFVCSYLQYVRVPVRRVLDVGCGIGLWRDAIAQQFPAASYQGVEYSAYLCERYGWARGSVTDWQPVDGQPFDLVICQGVLPYLNPADLKRALANLGSLSRGGLYIEAVAKEDYDRDIIDDTLTDPRLFRHRADVYRRGLKPRFTELGGGVWLSNRCDVPLFALESVDD